MLLYIPNKTRSSIFKSKVRFSEIFLFAVLYIPILLQLIHNMTSLEWGAEKRSKITRNTHDTAYYEPAFDFVIPDAGTSHISALSPDGDAVSIASTINT